MHPEALFSSRLAARALLTGALLALVPTAFAQTEVEWSGAGANALWSNNANWVGGSFPLYLESARFGPSSAQTQLTLDSDWGLDSLIFTAGASAHTITVAAGMDLDLYGDGIVNNSSATQTIALSGSYLNFYNSASAGNATIVNHPGSIVYFTGNSSAGNATILGDSTVQFTDNASAGNAAITSSFILLGSNSTGGTAAFTVTEGGSLQISGNNNASITIGSVAGASSNSYISFDDKTLVTGGNHLDTTFAGYLYGSTLSALVKEGTGTFTLTANNTNSDFQGLTTINGGTLQIGNGGTTGSLSGTSKVVINDGGVLAFNRSNAHSFSRVIEGTGSLTKLGAGTLTLSGTNTYSGGTLIKEGLISFNDASRLGSGNITFDGGGLLWGNSTTLDLSNRFNAIAAGGARFDVGGNNVAFATALTGDGGITKSGTGTLTLNAANTYAGATTVTAGTLTFGANGTLGSTTGAINVSGGTLNLATKTMTTGTVTISGGTISNGTLTGAAYAAQGGTISAILAGGGELTKTTSGTTILSGVNTFNGGVTVSAGTLRATTSASALGAGTLALNGGTLELAHTANLAFNRNTTVSGDATITANRSSSSSNSVTYTLGTLSLGAHTLSITRGTSITGAGIGGITFGATTLTGNATFAPGASTLLTLASVNGTNTDLTVNGDGNLTVSGALALGTGDLVKSGAGTLTLNGTTAYENLTLNGGTLTLGANADLGTGTLTMNGGTFSYAKSGGLGTRNIAVNGGTFAFTAASGAGTGTFTLNGGGLQWNGTNTLDVSSRLALTGAATFDTGSNSIAFNTALTATGALTKLGTGTLTLATGTTLAGLTTVSAGTLRTTDGMVFGSGGVALAGGSTLVVKTAANQSTAGAFTVSGTGTATYNFDRATAGAATTATFGPLTIGAQTLALTRTANVTSGTAVLAFTGTSTVTADPTFNVAAGTRLQFDSLTGNSLNGFRMTGAGDMLVTGLVFNLNQITKNGTGTLTLAHTDNTFTRRTVINTGTVEVTKLANAGQSSSLGAPTGDPNAINNIILISFGTAGTLRYIGSTNSSTNRTVTLAGDPGVTSILDASGTGTVSFTGLINSFTTGNRSLTLTGTNTGANTISGTIVNPATSGSNSVVKTGTGSWTLSGNNSYTGTTAINQGTLIVNGSIASSSLTTVANGARLGGSGTVGALTLASGSTLAVGNSVGTLTAGNTTWAGGATYEWELVDATGVAGTGYDLLSISAGTLTLTATSADRFTLTLLSLVGNNFNSAIDSSYTIASASGGIFGFDADAFTVNTTGFTSLNGGTWSLALGNSNRDLNLRFTSAAIPEPSTYAALLGAAVLALSLYRKRQRRL